MTKTILIVDDSDNLRLLVSVSLTSAGYEVIEAADGQAALKLLDGRAIHLFITDLTMPIMDGFEFVKRVKRLATYESVPVLMLTAESQQAKKEEGKDAGVFAWMVKPFSPLQLIKVVDMLCM